MRSATSIEDLKLRSDHIRSAMIGAAVTALVFVVIAILLFDSGHGVGDVHVPEDGKGLLLNYPGGLPGGQPYAVDRDLGRVAQILCTIIQTSTLGAVGLIIWGLVKRRKAIAYGAIVWLVLVSYAGPIPTMMQPTPPIAVGVPVARAALRVSEPPGPAWLGEKVGWRRYMLAQIAYAEGDKAIARRLSQGLNPFELASPIEGDYRLSFLRGDSEVASACFKFGCLDLETQRRGEIIALALALLACCATGLAGFVWWTLRRRRVAIDALIATHRRIGVLA